MLCNLQRLECDGQRQILISNKTVIETVLSDSNRKLQEILDEFMGKQDPTHKLHPDGVSDINYGMAHADLVE